MGRDLQKKKNRSGKQPVRQPQRRKKLLNPLGNSIIAKNWNKKETLSQNYRRLGLVSKLNGQSGGTEISLAEARERRALKAAGGATAATPLSITNIERAIVTETRVERDAEGRIVRVISARPNPLNDPLNELDDEEEWGGIEEDVGEDEDEEAGQQTSTGVVSALEEIAGRPEVKKPRHQSGREKEWLERLVARYGSDTRAMARDRKLNPMQQTEADIAKRLKKWRAIEGQT